MIPKLIHQIWIQGGDGLPTPPASLAAAAHTWRNLDESWAYRLWEDRDIDSLFAELRPDLLSLYRSYPYAVQKADAGRYLILYSQGGCYVDFDIECVRPPEVLLDNDLILAPTEPFGTAIDFMMAVPGHDFFTRVLDELPRSRLRWHRSYVPRHFRVMCGTGSLHLTRVWRASGGFAGARLLTAGEYGHGEPDEALVHHIEGNSWAGWDTHALVLLQNHWRKLVLASLILVVALAFWLR